MRHVENVSLSISLKRQLSDLSSIGIAAGKCIKYLCERVAIVPREKFEILLPASSTDRTLLYPLSFFFSISFVLSFLPDAAASIRRSTANDAEGAISKQAFHFVSIERAKLRSFCVMRSFSFSFSFTFFFFLFFF